METLNKCFEDVCELDLIFQVEKVHHVMDEVVMGGMVLETSLSDIVEAVDAQRYPLLNVVHVLTLL